MIEREIIKQLNTLKSVKADCGWKENNRSILVSQIFGSQTEEKKFKFNWPLIFVKELPFSMVQSVSGTFATGILVFFFLASAGTASLIAARETKPGDSLYAAKIAGEKAQYVLTFNEEDKAKLGMEFAGNRAEEITKVLAETPSDKQDETVVNLVNDFKKEINNVRTKLEKNKPVDNSSLAKTEIDKTGSAKTENKDIAEGDNGKFYGADIGKDDKGVELSGPVDNNKTEKTTTTPIVEDKPVAGTTIPEKISSPQSLLEEAKVFLDNKNYDETLNKLDEADKAISQVGQEPVKEEVKVEVKTEATTTEVKK